MNTTDILAKLDQLDDLSRAIRAAVMAGEESIPTTELGFQAPSHWPVLPKGDSWHNPEQLPVEYFGMERRPLTVKEMANEDKWFVEGAARTPKRSMARFTWDVPAHWPINYNTTNTNETQAES